MAEPAYQYVGDELTVFAHAQNWKRRLAAEISPFLGRSVLEVGAGLGETCRVLIGPDQQSWTLLEPDPSLAASAQRLLDEQRLPKACTVRIGGTDVLGEDDLYDCIVYVDVLEHIDDDAGELARAAVHVTPGGHLVVLSPAHQWLFTPFDQRIGHFRRYSRRTLLAVAPAGLRLVRLRYLDATGMLASAANRMLLRQSLPSVRQILVWDRLMVPVSRIIDPLTRYHIGKSILAVWKRPDTSSPLHDQR